MKKSAVLVCAAIVACFLLSSCAGKTAFYRAGDPIHAKRTVKIDDVLSDPKSYADQVVMVEGRVKEVCQGMGCWALIEDTKSGSTLYTRSPEEDVVLPTTCTGSRIRVEGRFVYEEPTPMSCGGKMTEAEAGHACPQPVYYVTLAAVELRED
jgi:hypothetical protein